jgi:hypothetical protein
MTLAVPSIQPDEWARICRIEAARTTHGPTRTFLLELALEYEGIAGKAVAINPDDPMIQDAVADRLIALASTRACIGKRRETPTR